MLVFQVSRVRFSRQRQSLSTAEREILTMANQFHQEKQSLAAAARLNLATARKESQESRKIVEASRYSKAQIFYNKIGTTTEGRR